MAHAHLCPVVSTQAAHVKCDAHRSLSMCMPVAWCLSRMRLHIHTHIHTQNTHTHTYTPALYTVIHSHVYPVFSHTQVVEKDLLIQEKEKLYMELKNILARQPGPEVAEQLSIYQANLREKTKQMKAMASELNMYQAQVSVCVCMCAHALVVPIYLNSVRACMFLCVHSA